MFRALKTEHQFATFDIAQLASEAESKNYVMQGTGILWADGYGILVTEADHVLFSQEGVWN